MIAFLTTFLTTTTTITTTITYFVSSNGVRQIQTIFLFLFLADFLAAEEDLEEEEEEEEEEILGLEEEEEEEMEVVLEEWWWWWWWCLVGEASRVGGDAPLPRCPPTSPCGDCICPAVGVKWAW